MASTHSFSKPGIRAGLREIFRATSPVDWVALALVVIALLIRGLAYLGHDIPHTGFLTFVGIISAAYLIVRLILIARKTILWRLRNRLIVAYVFIAVVPFLLILTMMGLAGYLLELQIGAHLLRDDLHQRESMIAADASAIAGVVGREPDLKPAPAAPQFGPGGRGGPGGRADFGGRGGRGDFAGTGGRQGQNQSQARGQGPNGGRGGFNPNGQPGAPRVLSPDELENMKILDRPSIAGVIAAEKAEWPELDVSLNIGSDLIQDKASGQFAGLVEFGNRLYFASVQVLPVAGGRNTIFVRAPVTPALLDSFPSKLGPIQLTLTQQINGNRGGPPGGGRGQNGPGREFGGEPPNGGPPNAGPSNGGPAFGRNPPSGTQQNQPPQSFTGSALSGAPPDTVSNNGRGGPRATITINGTTYYIGQRIASSQRPAAARKFFGDVRVVGSATFNALRVPGRNGGTDLPVVATYSFRMSAVNQDLLTSLGDFAPDIVVLLEFAAVIFVILEIAASATGFVLARTITHSVADLYDATVRIRSGDLSHRIHIERQDQLGALAESFNEMTNSVGELIDEQRQRQRLENEVSIAREVQLQLFPKKLPSIPGLELAAICRPARSVSGDYYDIIPLGGTRVGIALADISGKGIFASLLMASLQAALRSVASLNGNLDTAHIVDRLNQHLFQTTSDDRYATLFYGVYDTETRILNYTNAGHLPPLLITDGKVQTLADGGTVIGLIEDATYNQGSILVPPGSLLLVFSDGLTEPENVFGEEFGVERLRDEVLRERNVPARKLAEDLIDSAERWSGSPEQADDMTVVIARMA